MHRRLILAIATSIVLLGALPAMAADPAIDWGNKSCAEGLVWIRSDSIGSVYHKHGSPLTLDWSGTNPTRMIRNSSTGVPSTYWQVEVYGTLYATTTYAWCGPD